LFVKLFTSGIIDVTEAYTEDGLDLITVPKKEEKT